jgi:hypothetical protein
VAVLPKLQASRLYWKDYYASAWGEDRGWVDNVGSSQQPVR